MATSQGHLKSCYSAWETQMMATAMHVVQYGAILSLKAQVSVERRVHVVLWYLLVGLVLVCSEPDRVRSIRWYRDDSPYLLYVLVYPVQSSSLEVFWHLGNPANREGIHLIPSKHS